MGKDIVVANWGCRVKQSSQKEAVKNPPLHAE